MKVFSGFRLLKRAFELTRREITASLVILLAATLVLSAMMWLAERNSEGYDILDALVWVIVKYVDDPADVVQSPVTLLGQFIGTLVGLLGVAIFAVPAGLVGSGLLDAMAEEKKEEITAINSVKLHKRFRRIPQPTSWFFNDMGHKVTLKCVPRFRTFPHIKMKTGMTEEELIAAVNNCPDMRMMNMAATQPSTSKMNDDLVVVHFPLNTEYGCCVDRKSDVTIVAPAAVTELGTGSFAYSLAAMGGFNYVSKELTPNPDDPFGFYTMNKSRLHLVGDPKTKEDVELHALHFMDDLHKLKGASLASGRRHWFIFVLGTTKSKECQIHFWRLATKGDMSLPAISVNGVEYGSTVMSIDEEALQQIFFSVKEKSRAHQVQVKGESQPIVSCLDNNNVLKSVLKSNIMCRIGGGIDCNAVTLRVSYDILVHNDNHLLVVKDIADAIKSCVEPGKDASAEAQDSYLKEGDGYADAFGETVFFESNPSKLREMIASQTKAARKMFGEVDPDGQVRHGNNRLSRIVKQVFSIKS